MCGLFGWSLSEEGMMAGSIGSLGSTLAMANELRGPDSWGIAYPGPDDKVMIQKTVGLITRRLHFRMMKHRVLMAHTRRKTAGAISEKNAHPWCIGNIVGAHNGIINNFEQMKLKHEAMKDYEVDSQVLLHSIAHKLPITDVHGWGTVEYFDLLDPGTIYLGRGDQGDLAVAGIGTSKKTCLGVVWSSALYDLERALRLAGFPFFIFRVKEKRLIKLKNGRLEKCGRFDLTGTYIYQSGGRGEDNWNTRNPIVKTNNYGGIGETNHQQMVSIPPSFLSLPETSVYWIPGLILDEVRNCYVKNYPSYVEFYTRKGYPPDSPMLEKWRGPRDHASQFSILNPEGGVTPSQHGCRIKVLGKDTTETPLPLIPVGDAVLPQIDHLLITRTRQMACEGCDEIKTMGLDTMKDVLVYFPRLAKQLCLQCRMEWAVQTGEGKVVE